MAFCGQRRLPGRELSGLPPAALVGWLAKWPGGHTPAPDMRADQATLPARLAGLAID